MRVTMLLADAAQVANGKLFILGGGWTICGPEPTLMAIAIKLEVGPDEAGQSHDWSITLVDEGGEQVLLDAPDGQRLPVEVGGKFEAIPSPDVPPEVPFDLPMAISVGPLPLPPGRGFAWQFAMDGQTRDEWQVGFRTRPVTRSPT
jgi:uncharacterized protein DUF6941